MPKNEQPSFIRYKKVATVLAREPALQKAGGDMEMVQKPNGSLVPFPALVIRTTNAFYEAGRDPWHVTSQEIIQQAAILAKLVKPEKADAPAKAPVKGKGAVVSAVPARARKPVAAASASRAAKSEPEAEVDTAPGPAKQRMEKRPTDVAIAVYALLANAYELIERHDKATGVKEVLPVEDALKWLEKVSQRYKKLSQVVPGA